MRNWLNWLTPGQKQSFDELTRRYDRDPRVMRKVVDGLADDLGLDFDEADEWMNESAHETRGLDYGYGPKND